MRRARSLASVALAALVAVTLACGVVALWARASVFDSTSFSERAVNVLESGPVRRQLSVTITDQLIGAGNRVAVAARPAVEVAIDAVASTDAFQAVFRNGVRRAHQEVLDGGAGRLDLSSAATLLSGTIELSSTPGFPPLEGLSGALDDVSQRVADVEIWGWRSWVGPVGWLALAASVVLGAASVLVAPDRGRAVRRVGVAVSVAGALVLAARFVATRRVAALVDDAPLGDALARSVGVVSADLRFVGWWMIAAGVVVAAAATGAQGAIVTPAAVARRARQMSSSAPSWVVPLGWVGVVCIGAVALASPGYWAAALVAGAALWLVYLGVSHLTRMAFGARDPRAADRRPHARRRFAVGVVGALGAVAALGAIALVGTGASEKQAEAAGAPRCEGDPRWCDLRLDEVVLAGTHNSMAAARSPGWLFAEHLTPIDAQLESGVRALLIDTYYGVPSDLTMPGSDRPIVLTDRASEVARPLDDPLDPEVVERARALAARASPAVGARRDIYLCHGFCELGSSSLLGELRTIAAFLDSHPDDIVILVIQDATSPADTAAVFEEAGLAERAASLEPGAPLPRLGELVEQGRTLLVFAEVSGPGAPSWYHRAYDWFQETPYDFRTIDDFSCVPNRGPGDAPLFLLNHWVSVHPKRPDVAAEANSAEVLETRARRCLAERGLRPNVVAVDFSELGDVLEVATRLTDERADERPPPLDGAPPTQEPAEPLEPLARPDRAQPLPEPDAISVLTGGEPARFCRAATEAYPLIGAWTTAWLAVSSGDTAPDHALAPALTRSLPPLLEAAPLEVAAVIDPILQRARAASDDLRAAGLDDDDLEGIAAATLAEASFGLDGLSIAARAEVALAAATAGAALPPLPAPDLAPALGLLQLDPDILDDAGFTAAGCPS